MKLLTTSQRETLIANFRQNQQNLGETDHWPVVKLFTPDANATWLLTEFDPVEELLFGLCDLGLGLPELGYVALAELTELRGPFGLAVECDRYWQPEGPLSAYVEDTTRRGHIQA